MAIQRCIQVLNGVIENIIMADPLAIPALTDGSAIIASETGNVGDSYAGGVVTPASTSPAVPASVALWQAKGALSNAGLLTAADSAIAATNDIALETFWATATSVNRDDSFVANIGATLGLTGAQIDQLFISAAQIAV